MDRRNFLQLVGISILPAVSMAETKSSPNPNMIQWKDIKEEQPTDENRTYLVFSDCHECPSSDICNLKGRGAHCVFRTRWYGGSAQQFGFCLEPWRITHWTYFNTPETDYHYKKFVEDNPYIVA
jgi:hypothetical protein